MKHNAKSDIDKDIRDKEEHLMLLNGKAFDFNIVQKEIGNLGRYQVLLITMVYLVIIPCGINMMSTVFLQATPKHWCSLPFLCQNIPIEKLKIYAIPFNNKTEITLMSLMAKQFVGSLSKRFFLKKYYTNEPIMAKQFVGNSKWNLVCSKAVLAAVADSLFFVGILLGGLFGGYLSDRFGRLPVMRAALTLSITFGISVSFSPTLQAYIILRFCLAIFIQMGYLCGFVYVIEITGDRWRTLVGINVQTMFAVGTCILSLSAFCWRNWRDLQLYVSLYPFIILFCLFFVPESPRWLFSRGEYVKGKAICEKIANLNGKPLRSSVWELAESDPKKILSSNEHKHYSISDLFKPPRIRWLTFAIIYLWFAVSLVYYGLALNVASLAGNVFLNSALNALVEPIGYIIIVLSMDRLGRKPMIFITFITGGVCCLFSTLLQTLAANTQAVSNLTIAVSLLGKMAIAGSFATIYNYTAEIFPTVIRSTGLGAGYIGARVGGMISPFTLFLNEVLPWISGVIYGIASIAAALIILFLPETLNKPMLSTIEETENSLSKRE